MKRLLLLIALVVGIVLAWYFASPWWTLKQMRDAARAGEVEALGEYVDWEALRADIAGDIADDIVAGRSSGNAELDRIAGVMIERSAREAAERLVTPRALAMAFSSVEQAQKLGIPLPALKAEGLPAITYRSLDRVEVRASGEDKGADAPAYVLTRSGLGWKLSGLE
ncbi:DUF2939 domain-containing protein [Sphingomicrobium astaxanthinifaciens]|uniref:DUF2939 domain-containing protein n=1 Tax=Sphingomicrobium astaxanthinifaciens TaxID=1227949 RepID=UPI001FCAD513|nr:DUF2939 domain-containing protein [Sphingomicrobium astaxanthinifaciens]MCJ7420574.1 DUF2939 domain-containing protein [Sphingomicrobium astaxanthinifaciens]